MKHRSIGRRRRERNLIIAVAMPVCIAIIVLLVFVFVHVLSDETEVSLTSSSSEQTTVTEPSVSSEPAVTTISATVTPTPLPADTPTPTPSFITSLDGYEPGDVIPDELIDTGNLSQYFTINEINEGDAVFARIEGQSFVYNNDIGLSDLRYLKMLHVNFDGCYQVGEMIVNASVAQQVTEIFEQLCEARYEIYSMYLIDDFWVGNGTDSDTESIDHNNTSCFCYRPASGSSHLSLHALGLAIDIHPQQNPYVRVNSDGSLSCSHENAQQYVTDRSSDVPHVITESDYAYGLFISAGWTWGGSWNNPRDYQHFQFS